MRRLIRPILLLLALALTGCGKDNPVTPGPPDLPLPTYYSVETGVDNGFLIGWSSVTTPYTDSVWRGETYLPEHHPWSAWRTLELADDPRADWTVGPLGGPRAGDVSLPMPAPGPRCAPAGATWTSTAISPRPTSPPSPSTPAPPRPPPASASPGWPPAARPGWS